MNRYADYKETGFEWISEIPKHWEIKKLKHLVSYNTETLSENTDPDYRFHYIEIGDVDYIEGVSINGKITFNSSPSRARRVVKTKDVVVSTVRTYLRAIGVIPELDDVVCSTGFCVLRDRTGLLDQDFLSYSVRSEWFISKVISNSYGVSYPAINSSELVEVKIVLPPLHEQKLISRYLDKKAGQIDSLIEKIQKKIKLLKEQRTSLINQCVTKGLDPNVEMKDSSVRWIGEIPKHWKYQRLKFVSKQVSDKRLPQDGDIKISPENVESKTGKILNFYSDYETKGQIFQPGDILFNKLRVYLNKVVLCEFDGLSMGEMIVIRPKSITSVFLHRILNSSSFIEHVNSLSEGVKLPRPPADGIFNSYVILPPETEQLEITSYLGKKLKNIDRLVGKQNDHIQLISEYRQSLISSVVTGKVRVTEDMV